MDKVFTYIKNNKKEIIYITIITIIATIYRVLAFKSRGAIWHDEIFSVYFAMQDNFFELIKKLWIEDVHAPLYFIILNIFGSIFGKTYFVYRLVGMLFSILTIPISYFVGKKLFNQRTGYIFSLLLTFNLFFIYYSVEIRFYGILVLFGLLSTYYFFQFIEEQKSFYKLIVSNLLIVYTFNIGIIYVIIQGIVGLIYSISKKSVIKNYAITCLLSLPIIAFLIKTSIVYSNAIASFSGDIFYIDGFFLYELCQTYFSSVIFIINKSFEYGIQLLQRIPNIIFCTTPVIISIFLILKNIKERKQQLLILTPVIFILFETFMGLNGKMWLVTRHTIISLPAIILALSYGFASIKNKKLGTCLFCLLLFLQILPLHLSKNNLLFKHFSNNLEYNLKKISNDDSVIIFTETGDEYKKVFNLKHTYYLPVDKATLRNDRVVLNYIFDKDILNGINKQNSSEKLAPYLRTNKELTNLKTNLEKDFIKNNQYQTIYFLVGYPNKTLVNPKEIDDFRYNNDKYRVIHNKTNNEILKVLNKHYQLSDIIQGEKNAFIIFEFKK